MECNVYVSKRMLDKGTILRLGEGAMGPLRKNLILSTVCSKNLKTLHSRSSYFYFFVHIMFVIRWEDLRGGDFTRTDNLK